MKKKKVFKHWIFFTDAMVCFFPSVVPLLILEFSKNKSLAQNSSVWIQERGCCYVLNFWLIFLSRNIGFLIEAFNVGQKKFFLKLNCFALWSEDVQNRTHSQNSCLFILLLGMFFFKICLTCRISRGSALKEVVAGKAVEDGVGLYHVTFLRYYISQAAWESGVLDTSIWHLASIMMGKVFHICSSLS